MMIKRVRYRISTVNGTTSTKSLGKIKNQLDILTLDESGDK